MTSAEQLIAEAKALLLDFDGPVTALMPPPLNAEAAESARRSLKGIDLPEHVRATTDHLAVLRWCAENAVGRLSDVERACTEAEIACAQTSEPSPEVGWLIEDAKNRGVPVAIVSNNSEEAVWKFMERFAWPGRIAVCACRTPEIARLLKPHQFLVVAATQILETRPSECVFVGDSVSDVEAGHAAGVPVVGLAQTPKRAAALTEAGAIAIIQR